MAEPTIPVCPAIYILSVFCIIGKAPVFKKREVSLILAIQQNRRR
jgi:hypothetical protein